MKRLKLVSAAIVLTGATAISANAALLAYEPFSGTENALVIGSSGGFGFSGAWNTNNNAQTENPSGTATAYFTTWNLGYEDSFGNVLVTSPGSAFFQGSSINNFSWQGVRPFDFSRGTNGTDGGWTWISMLTIRTGPTNGAVANPYPRGVNVVQDMTFGQAATAQLQKVGVGNGSGAAANTVAILSSGGNIRPSANPQHPFAGNAPEILVTNLIILGVQHVQDGLDNAYLWVNPDDLTFDFQANLGTASTNVLGVYDYSFDRLRVFVGGNANSTQRYGELYLDEYRVGESAGDVLPIVPEPAVAAIGGLGILALLMYRRRK